MSSKKNITCPTCQKKSSFEPSNLFRPFCSERCKLIDLGAWADEKHRVAGEPVNPNLNPEEDEEEK